MIGLDTNVLVRYLVQDDAEQSASAARLIEGGSDRGEVLFVSQIVLCEVVWVLQAAYKVPRAEVVAVLGALVRTRQITIEEKDIVHRCLFAFDQGRGDFADYVIRERASTAGCEHVATFDKTLLKEEGFVRP
jgi:predicted nucleic-acid-binding protein